MGRRRYELKLSRFGPESRTVFIASIVLMLALAISGTAFARELRVVTPANLLECTDPFTWGALTAPSPDAGQVSAPGDTCVVFPGTYTLGAQATVTLANLTIRSSNGALVTIITGNIAGALIAVRADGVTIGGPGADQGFTIVNTNAAGDGISVGVGAAPGQADENITIQNNIIRDNPRDGVIVNFPAPTSIESFKIAKNQFLRNNTGGTGLGGLAFGANVSAIGRRGPDRNIVIEENIFVQNTNNNIVFGNTGTIEQTAILNNEIQGNGVSNVGINFGPTVTSIRNIIISGNLVQNNVIAGIAFFNSGRIEDSQILGNRGATPSQGITGNGIGIGFAPAVPDVRDVSIEDNAINSNTLPFLGIWDFGGGVVFLNTGSVEGLRLIGNEIRQNIDPLNAGLIGFFAGFYRGVSIFGPGGGDFTRSEIRDNTFRNNAGLGGFFIFHTLPAQRIDNLVFSGNDFRENGAASWLLNVSAGVGLVNFVFPVGAQDISAISFTNNTFFKNAVLGLVTFTNDGDTSEIELTDLTVNETQGAFPIPIATAGTGISLLTMTGDEDTISLTNVTANNNGGFGLQLEALGATPGDIDNITIKNSTFNYNGQRAPVGFGSGISIRGQTVRDVTIDPTTANYNNDHGVQISSDRDIMSITVENSEFSFNDRNVDTVGNGISLSANQNLDTVVIKNTKANSNNIGIRIAAQDRIGRKITIQDNPEINDNRNIGIELFGGRDLSDITVSRNSLAGNAIGIQVRAQNRGSSIGISDNKIAGKDGFGTGVLLDSTGVTIEKNSIRRNATGIEARKVRDNAIHNNNIARNENYGVDATALSPGEAIDATNNWWGEPSGPKHATNPNGIGDRVTDKVKFDPWLREPAVKTAYSFEILSFTGPTEVDRNVEVEYKGQVKNTGTEEGTQDITLTVTLKADGTVVGTKSVTKTINPQATTDVSFKYKFPQGGAYQVCLETQDARKCLDVTVKGPALLTIEQAVAQHSGSPTIIEDPDIIWAVELWVEDTIVPGTDGLKIDDAKILQLVGMWIEGTPVAGASAQAQQPKKKGFNFFDWLMSFFAARPAAVAINSQASPSRVAPGEAFTVTVNVGGEVKGLLLAPTLPAGWTITPVETGPAFYKPSEQKWLLLGSGTLSYKVTVPADAAPGTYTLSGSYITPEGEGALKALTIEVTGEPVALKVDAVKFTGSRFVVEGLGIASVEARVWNLAGKLVFSGKANGSALAIDGVTLANGVYLYAVTVRGADGQALVTAVRKMVVLR
jgi:hypothetical protein